LYILCPKNLTSTYKVPIHVAWPITVDWVQKHMEHHPSKSQNRLQDPSKVDGITQNPLSAWFLGPKAEHADVWAQMLMNIFNDYIHWRRNYFPEDPIIINRTKRRQHEHWFDQLDTELETVLNQLKAHFPFYSPRYIAHMLSEQTLPSVVGYFAGMLYNPNNVTDESASVTVPLELEVGKMVAAMLGYNPETAWAHICSGGTVANIEALWVARTVQFLPFVVQEYCKKHQLEFQIRTPNKARGQTVSILEVPSQTLIALKSNQSVRILRKLAHYLIYEKRQVPEVVLQEINEHVANSLFNVSKRGLFSILNRLSLHPRIYVSESAHYSIKKAANILGYGEDAVVPVPVDTRFRMDVRALRELLLHQKSNEYTACVIAVAGTTEEGAVDPVHRIKFLRDELNREHNRSFWLHVDGAWGGYFRSLFCHPDLAKKETGGMGDVLQSYADKLDVRESFTITHQGKTLSPPIDISWRDPETYGAFLAFPDADSITIDPHKMGYIPYPAGIIAFKQGIVTEHIIQKAQYISEEEGGLHHLDHTPIIHAVGPYILEGSKPGAAAAACYLAHKTIPLETHGHGKIIRTSVLNTRRFAQYLNHHKKLFRYLDEQVFGKQNTSKFPFTFVPVYDPPDTNIVCFVAVPMAWHDDTLVRVDSSLAELNRLNQMIYDRFTIRNKQDTRRSLYSQDFFVSRTRFMVSQYSTKSVSELLKMLKVSKADYKKEGLFVLRSTVMNPWHHQAQLAKKDYLFDFVLSLHEETREIRDLMQSKIM